MPIPEFVVEIRKMIGHHEMWLPGVTAVVTRGQEILLVRRADNGQWTPITGIPEPGEEPGQAIAREALEETGVEVDGRPAGLDQRRIPVSCTPTATGRRTSTSPSPAPTSSGEAHVADDESIDVRWFPVDALPEMAPAMLQRIADALSGEQAARFVR